MKKAKSNLTGTGRERVKKYVKELSSWLKSCLTREKNWAIPYLGRTYELYCNWNKKGISKERRKDLIAYRFRGTPVRKDKTVGTTVRLQTEAKSQPENESFSAA